MDRLAPGYRRLVAQPARDKAADWQVTRLNAAFEKEQNLENRQFVIEKSGAILVPGSNATSFTFRHQNEPSATISDTQRVGNRPKAVLICEKPVTVTRALLIQSKNANQEYGAAFGRAENLRQRSLRMENPVINQRALLIPALNSARVVQISSRCLARFQTLPDWYNLPAKNNLACKGIGNGVPCSFAKAIVQSLIGENS
jgi:site-specific DNA-cytosine methylase